MIKYFFIALVVAFVGVSTPVAAQVGYSRGAERVARREEKRWNKHNSHKHRKREGRKDRKAMKKEEKREAKEDKKRTQRIRDTYN